MPEHLLICTRAEGLLSWAQITTRTVEPSPWEWRSLAADLPTFS